MATLAHRANFHDYVDHGEPFLLAPSKWRRWISPQLIRICDGDVAAAYFLAQCCHWDSWKRKQAEVNGEHGDPDGWFYKNIEEFESELALSGKVQRRVRLLLAHKKLLFEEKQGCNPPRIFFAVNWKGLRSLLRPQGAEKSSRPPNGHPPRCPTGTFATSQRALSYKEAERLTEIHQGDKTVLSLSSTSTASSVFGFKPKKNTEAVLIVDRNMQRITGSLRELNEQFCDRVLGERKEITDAQLRDSIDRYRECVESVICDRPECVDDAWKVVALAREKFESAMDTYIAEHCGHTKTWRDFIKADRFRQYYAAIT